LADLNREKLVLCSAVTNPIIAIGTPSPQAAILFYRHELIGQFWLD
jgi:hypothetical protein